MSQPVKYSLDEIDRLRTIIYRKLTWDLDCYSPDEIDEKVEAQLRTAMMAGVNAEEEEEIFDKHLTAARQQHKG